MLPLKCILGLIRSQFSQGAVYPLTFEQHCTECKDDVLNMRIGELRSWPELLTLLHAGQVLTQDGLGLWASALLAKMDPILCHFLRLD